MRGQLRKYAPLLWPVGLVAISTYGAMSAIIFWLAGWTTTARDALAIPVCLLPSAVFLLWVAVGFGKTLDKVQNLVAGYWICPASAAVAYLATFLPGELVKATLAVAGAHVVVWLVLALITRKLYREKRQANIARASNRPPDDPEVQRLANNTLLATAVTCAMICTAQSIVVMEKYIADYFSTGAIRGIATVTSCTIGLALFNLHPTQFNIREFTSQSRQPKNNSEPHATK